MARTDVDWVNYQGRYIYPNHPTWFDLLIKWTSKYINFNTISWSTWYWIRDNAWAIEFKDSWWSWNGMFIDSFTEWSIPFAGSDWQLTESNATLFRETTWEIGIGTNSLTANDMLTIKAWTNWGSWNILIWQNSLWADQFEVTDQGTVSQEWWTIKPIKTITASTYTIPLSDSTILLDGTSNAVTATLPTAVWNTWQIFSIKCINIDYVCKLATNWTETIDWASDIEFVLYESKKIQSNGANRFIL